VILCAIDNANTPKFVKKLFLIKVRTRHFRLIYKAYTERQSKHLSKMLESL